MSKLLVPAVDAARAKTLARAVQRRHQELGTTVSLNHAYEAVAAVCGFETWSRMKSRLDAPGVETEQLPNSGYADRERVLAESGLSFDDLVPHDIMPSLVVSGPNSALQNRILSGLVSRWRAIHGSDARVRLITKRPKPGYIEQMQRILASGAAGASFEALSIKPMGKTILNPFDTPLGQRHPTPAHWERLVELLSMIMSEHGQEPSVIRVLAGLLVDAAYDAVSDRTRKGNPKPYFRGIDERIDGRVFGDTGTITWWDVADQLAQCGHFELAMIAQAYAVPQMDLMMTLLRRQDLMSMYQSAMTFNGEPLLNFAARKIASAIRECSSLQFASNTTVDPNIRSIIIAVNSDDNPEFFGRLASKIFLDLCCPADHLPGQAALKERTLVILDSMDDAGCQAFLSDIDPVSRGSDKRKLHTIAMTRSAQAADRYSEVSSFLLHGFESRAEVSAFRKMIEFSDDAFEDAHNFLFDSDQSQSVALGVRRGFRTVTDGMVAIP